MNCSPTICIALLLLSLSAGMLLLYKTQKENLGAFFKVVAWFVIVASICSMICCAMCCMMRCCMKGNNCGGMEQCEAGGECGPGHGGMNKRVMIFKGGKGECEMEMSGCCKEGKGHCEEGEEACKEGKEACCEGEKEHCEMKKDSVVVKK